MPIVIAATIKFKPAYLKSQYSMAKQQDLELTAIATPFT